MRRNASWQKLINDSSIFDIFQKKNDFQTIKENQGPTGTQNRQVENPASEGKNLRKSRSKNTAPLLRAFYCLREWKFK